MIFEGDKRSLRRISLSIVFNITPIEIDGFCIFHTWRKKDSIRIDGLKIPMKSIELNMKDCTFSVIYDGGIYGKSLI